MSCRRRLPAATNRHQPRLAVQHELPAAAKEFGGAVIHARCARTWSGAWERDTESAFEPQAGNVPSVKDAPNDELIASAAAVLNPRFVGDRLFGDVGSTLGTVAGRSYSGMCIDTGSGTGFCAEHAAIAVMITAGESQIAKIVAVWRDADGRLYVVPPCGRCREFIRQVDPANIDTEVVTSRDVTVSMRELLPLSEWPAPLDRPTE
jgi:cytidine deaminase